MVGHDSGSDLGSKSAGRFALGHGVDVEDAGELDLELAAKGGLSARAGSEAEREDAHGAVEAKGPGEEVLIAAERANQ